MDNKNADQVDRDHTFGTTFGKEWNFLPEKSAPIRYSFGCGTNNFEENTDTFTEIIPSTKENVNKRKLLSRATTDSSALIKRSKLQTTRKLEELEETARRTRDAHESAQKELLEYQEKLRIEEQNAKKKEEEMEILPKELEDEKIKFPEASFENGKDR